MATLEAKEIQSALERKGFQKKGGDHIFLVYHRLADNKKTRVRTKMSHGKKTIGSALIGLMARQCKVTKSNFTNLVNCPLSREEYESLLVQAKVIEPGRDG